MKVKAYAKINLTLDITGRRENGFHTLDTVMQSVSLADELELIKQEKTGIKLMSNMEYLPLDTKNTAFRAAKYFFEHCDLQNEGISISIKKRIPSRAGMGGGSADAAGVLKGLDAMYNTGLSQKELLMLGEKVGADVPFCIQGGTCRCTGIGEKLETVARMPDCFLVICKPPAGMSTPRAFALVDRYPLSRKQSTPEMIVALQKGELRQVAARLSNRFDETMKLMQVKQIKMTMGDAGALGAMMTGSGSAVYGIFDSEEKARGCMQLLEGKGKIYLTHPIPYSVACKG